ncbi:carbohydrate ABC transporter permease [Poriferisphaera sp. WC338]|uniref:carbohydrate ABC transporter permease n=1 Tax=Poriferisphaera sp. WC338 TaxID=3425129 RepID=UPI003D816189
MKTKRLWLVELFVIFAVFLFIAPIVLIFITAFKPDAEILQFTSVLPKKFTTEHFNHVLGSPEEIPIFRWLLNSILIAGSVTFLVLTVDSLAAYTLARLKPKGSKLIFSIIVATMMVPGQVLLVPVYLLLNSLGWIDSPLAMIVPAGAAAFGVFLLRQFMLSIPVSLEEAAALDGCSKLRIYWHVILPNIRSALVTLGIFTFVGSWNDFMGPLIFLESLHKLTLPVGIAQFQTSYSTEYGLTLAACVICTLPTVIVFLIFHRHIIEGFSISGMKD